MHSFLHYCFHPCDGLERFVYEFCSHSIPAQWNILIPSVVQCGMWRRAVPTASNLCLLLRGCCGNSRLQHLWGATLCDLSLKSFGSALYRSRGIVVPCLPSREQYSSEKMPVCVRDDLYVVLRSKCVISHRSQKLAHVPAQQWTCLIWMNAAVCLLLTLCFWICVPKITKATELFVRLIRCKFVVQSSVLDHVVNNDNNVKCAHAVMCTCNVCLYACVCKCTCDNDNSACKKRLSCKALQKWSKKYDECCICAALYHRSV